MATRPWLLLWFLVEHQRKEEWWMILRVQDMHGKTTRYERGTWTRLPG